MEKEKLIGADSKNTFFNSQKIHTLVSGSDCGLDFCLFSLSKVNYKPGKNLHEPMEANVAPMSFNICRYHVIGLEPASGHSAVPK
jgi:hypothetical protein